MSIHLKSRGLPPANRLTLLQADQCDIIRDIFGNPFRKRPGITLTEDVCALARRIYDQSRYDQLPELGTALEAAGCEDETVLAHCRAALDHVRGCWVIDQLLGFG